MAKIVFKNGERLQVPQEVLVVLFNRVKQPEGAKQWQGFSEGISETVLYLINMTEILYVEADRPEKPIPEPNTKW